MFHKLVYIMGIIFIVWIIVAFTWAYSGYFIAVIPPQDEVEEETPTENLLLKSATREQVLINETEELDKEMVYSRIIELYEGGVLSVDISSDRYVSFALLPDYELRHFGEGESYRSYEEVSSLRFLTDEYRLDKGKYALVLSTGDKDTEISWVVIVKPLNKQLR